MENKNYKVYSSGVIVQYNQKHSANAGRKSQLIQRNPHQTPTQKLEIYENKKQPKKRVYRCNRNLVRSSSISLFAGKNSSCLLFFTVTLPEKISESEARRAWHSFLMNLRNSYCVKKYVWVKEYQANGNIHYHIIVDRAFIDIVKMQKTWNTCLLNHTSITAIGTNCSVRLGNQPRVYSIERVANYLSKYIAKDNPRRKKDIEKAENLKKMGIIDGEFSGKAYGISENIEFSVTVSYENIDKYRKSLLNCLGEAEIISEYRFCIIFLCSFVSALKLIRP